MPPSDKKRQTTRTVPLQITEERNVPTSQPSATLGDILQISKTTLNDIQELECRVSRMLQQLSHNFGSDGAVVCEEPRKTNGMLGDILDNQQETQYSLYRLNNDIETLLDLLSVSK